MKSAVCVHVVLICLTLVADAAVFTSKCDRVRCTACQRCVPSSGLCVADASQSGCGQSASLNGAISACSSVRCPECHTCRVNDAGQAKCVYESGCCPAGQSRVACFISSCQSQAAQCPNHANCIAADCGSCQAKFYDKYWNEICTSNSSNVTNNPSDAQIDACAVTLCPVNTKCVPQTPCFNPPCSARCEPLNACDKNPCQADEHCVFNPDIRCIQAPCPQYTCQKVDASNACFNGACPSGTRCIPETKFCKQPPCPQFRCEAASPCDGVQCPEAQICRPAIKQCLLPPCPQYECIADPCATARCPNKCVAENGQAKCVGNDSNDPCHRVQCPTAQICQPDVKQCLIPPCPQYKCIADPCATARCPSKCVTENGQAKCVGNDFNDPCLNVQCPTAQICRPDVKQCLTSPCPQYKCIADPCASARCPNKCVAENGQAKCVGDSFNNPCLNVQCPEAQICRPAIKQCLLPPCPQYECIADPCATARCPNKCVAENGQAKCVSNDSNDPCLNVQCPMAQICQPDVKQCLIPPCPQYKCIADPCATARCPSKCVTENGQAKCIERDDQPINLVRCSQLPDAGTRCKAVMQRWHFSRQSNRCEQFEYGGCEGNENNFLTENDCAVTCQNLPPCPIASVFIKEGCRMNGNVLNNSTLCPVPNIVCDNDINDCAVVDCMTGHVCQIKDGKATCVPVLDDRTRQCSQQSDSGSCLAFVSRFHYSRTSGQCLNFTYGGCGGNSNNFNTVQECQQRCTGTPPCPLYKMKDPPVGCKYNGTEMDEQLCPKPKLVCNKEPVDCATANCGSGQICVPSPKACLVAPCPQYDCIENPCNLVDCKSTRCIVVSGKAQCVDDIDGNDTRLKSCSQPPDHGPCDNAITRWYYNRQVNKCEQFTYGGCEGNQNRFETQEECNSKCSNIPPCPAAMPAIPPVGCQYIGTELNDAFCPMPKLVCAVEESKNCAALLCALDTVCQTVNGRGMCVDKSVSDNRIITCSALFEDNSNGPTIGICAGQKQSWRYNRLSSSCEQVTWSGCGKSDNIFASQEECNQRCAGVQPCPQIKPARPLPGCEYQGSQLNEFLCPEPKLICPFPTSCAEIMCTADSTCQVINGRAQCVSIDASDNNTIMCSGPIEDNVCAALPKWRYNRQTTACESIIWTGCSPNQNLFNTKEECDRMCSKVAACPAVKPAPAPPGCEYRGTELDQHLCPTPKLVCANDANCAAVSCLTGEECKMVDGIARCLKASDNQLQTCSHLPETGPCNAFMTRWYYNRQTSNCQRFNYSGCEGNANNFASLEECKQRCTGVPPCPIIDPMAPMTGCRFEGQRLDERLLCAVPKLVCDEKAACAAITCSSDQKCAVLVDGPKCVPASPAKCTVNVSVGSPCAADSPLPYYFNSTSGKCEVSIWKDCQGDNLFSTIKHCERQCIEQRECALPPVAPPPPGCDYEVSNDSEGCPTVFNLRCSNGQPPVS